MIESSDLRLTKMPLNKGAGYTRALSFGTLIPDTAVAKTSTRDGWTPEFDTPSGLLTQISERQ